MPNIKNFPGSPFLANGSVDIASSLPPRNRPISYIGYFSPTVSGQLPMVSVATRLKQIANVPSSSKTYHVSRLSLVSKKLDEVEVLADALSYLPNLLPTWEGISTLKIISKLSSSNEKFVVEFKGGLFSWCLLVSVGSKVKANAFQVMKKLLSEPSTHDNWYQYMTKEAREQLVNRKGRSELITSGVDIFFRLMVAGKLDENPKQVVRVMRDNVKSQICQRYHLSDMNDLSVFFIQSTNCCIESFLKIKYRG